MPRTSADTSTNSPRETVTCPASRSLIDTRLAGTISDHGKSTRSAVTIGSLGERTLYNAATATTASST